MVKFFLERIVTSIITLFMLSIVVFLMLQLAPGDPARLMLPLDATYEDVQVMRKELGLNKPIYVQYLVWLKKAVKFDFGKSIRGKESASKILLKRLPATLELILAGLLISVFFSIPIGIFVAFRRNSLWDLSSSIFSTILLSTPRFWLGILLILLFSVSLEWLPPFGRGPGLFGAVFQLFNGNFVPLWQSIKHLILPGVTLASWFFPIFMRHTRTNIIEEKGKLYVKTAREKGITENRVRFVHIIRNALIPIITIIALHTGTFLGGSVIIEMVFAWPGVGQLLVDALFARDYPLIQAGLLMIGTMIVSIFILMDMIYGLIDPRIRINQ